MDGAGPWGTGPYRLVEGFSIPDKRSDRVVLEGNTSYWKRDRFPRLRRIVFENILSQKEAVEAVKSGEGRVDLVTELSPLETLHVAQSPFATVVKNRNTLATVFGQFNMRRAGSPWHDVRLRRAANLAVNRADLVPYGANGNGVVVPALIPPNGFGYDPKLAPYPFDAARAQQLLREAGYPNGLPVSLIAPEDLGSQATVVAKMLEPAGFRVTLQVLDTVTFNRKTDLAHLDQPAPQQTWNVALTPWGDTDNFPLFSFYHYFAIDGPYVWIGEPPELRQLYDEVLRTVDRAKQERLMQQMERLTHDQAYFLFLYSPIGLYAANKAVSFVPHATGVLHLSATSVTAQHWSMRKGAGR